MNNGKQTAIIVTVLGLVFSYYSWTIKRATIGNPIEPLLFPLLLGILLTLCGILLLLTENRKKIIKLCQKANKCDGISHEVKMIIIICVSGVLYGLLLEKIGYVISTTLFLGTLLFAFNGKKQWLVNLTVSVVFSVSIYVCFSKVLGIPLPQIPFLRI